MYEAQVAVDLTRLTLPDDWKQPILDAAVGTNADETAAADTRRQLEARRDRLRDLYAWGELSAAAFKAERTAIDAELARLTPAAPPADDLDALAGYVESLTTAWADASQAERSELANIIYEEVWVDGPRVTCIKPRPDIEPLFRATAGAAQPVVPPAGVLHQAGVGSSSPESHRGRLSEL